jgi:glutathione S-transferase
LRLKPRSFPGCRSSRHHPPGATDQRRALEGGFCLAEQRLARRDWAVGRYSIADIHLFRLYWRFHRTLKTKPSDYPGLAAHHDRMMARPAVKRTCEIESAIGYELP